MRITPIEVANKILFPKFYDTIDDCIMASYPFLVDQLDKLENNFINNEEFQNYFINKFDELANFITMQINWRLSIKFLDKIIKIEILFEKFIFTSKLFGMVMKFLQDENANNLLKSSSMKTLVYILKFCKKIEKEEILKFIEKEIVENKSFYKRRLYFMFFEEAIKIFSISTLINYHIIDYIFKFLNDNTVILAKVIKMMKYIYPLICNDVRLKFIINTKFENLKKMVNLDMEIKKVKNFQILCIYF